ncbi:peptidase domain-containing ABC transporter [Nocardia gamkensis]|nr:peptidase domain-containing ABC transporter [Nocardia gamkensis]NQE70727.1 putative microcin-H47 secretion/processing ATP-binding protein MchF [Nocardia gamkensis]
MSGDSENATRADSWDASGRFRRHAVARGGRIGNFGSPRFVQGTDPVERDILNGFRRGVRAVIPEGRQVGDVDCGPASLQMALASRGIDVPLEQLRKETDSGRNGTSAAALLRVARLHGMDGRGVRSNLAGLRHLAPGSILFWRFNHFVVLEGAVRSYAVVLDPAVGRRRIPWSEIDEEFTGVAIEFAAPSAEGARTRRSGWRRIAGELGPASWIVPRTSKWGLALAASAALLIYNLAYPYVLGEIVSWTADGDAGFDGELRYGALLVAAVLSYGAMHLVRSRLIVTIQSLVEARIGETLMARVTRLPLEFFLGRHPGDLALRVRSAGRFKQVVSVSTLGAAFDAVLIVGYLIVVGSRDIALGAVAATGVLAFVLGMAVTWRRQRQLSVAACAAQVEAANVVHELFANMTTVKALGAEGAVHARWLNTFSGELTAGTRKRRHAGSVSVFVSALQFATPLTVLFTGILTAGDGSAGLTDAVTLSAVSAGLFVSLSNLSLALTALVDLVPDMLRIDDVLNSAVEPCGSAHLGRTDRAVSVRLDRVSFSYPGSPRETIREVDIDVGRGALTVIAGRSGCGKSTIGMLLAGLLFPGDGRVLVDDTDLANLDLTAYRRHIGYVDQNSGLMAGSVLENIRLGDESASLDDVRRAARMAQIDEFIEGLPMKYETILSASGGGISGGQRQRIALARALVKNPRLLILDEATSAVDPETEQAIFRELTSLDATVIVLGHRVPPGCGECDVVVVEDGRVRTSAYGQHRNGE